MNDLEALDRDGPEQDQMQQGQRLELIGALTGGIAHDINNQLMVILNHLDFCLRGLDPENPTHASLSVVQRAALRCADMTARLLRFSRKSEPLLKSTQLADVLEETKRFLRDVMPRSVKLCFCIWPNLPMVCADATQIQQVLVNLSVNARDAMPNGGSLEIRADAIPGFVVLSVSDTGAGIPPELQTKIFEPFFTTRGETGGTGLGLAMVAAIVQIHKGSIDVSSVPGVGSCFRIKLPVECGKAELPGESVAASGAPERGCVLVADDDDLVRRVAVNILAIHGYKVLEANNGVEAVRVFQENAGLIDLAFFDVTMPKATGVEALSRIRAEHPNVKALLTSGYDVLVGGPFLPKPYTSAELMEKVWELLGGDIQ
ncbi:MAG: ATP-binding protein [Acidobacteriota bacterium]|nr:ATP-binding protein [Acidobacteriota bacterium]